jgi:hypothetical protein
MNNLNTKFDNMEHSQREFDKQINKLIAEATILLYEIEALNKKGVLNK